MGKLPKWSDGGEAAVGRGSNVGVAPFCQCPCQVALSLGAPLSSSARKPQIAQIKSSERPLRREGRPPGGFRCVAWPARGDARGDAREGGWGLGPLGALLTRAPGCWTAVACPGATRGCNVAGAGRPRAALEVGTLSSPQRGPLSFQPHRPGSLPRLPFPAEPAPSSRPGPGLPHPSGPPLSQPSWDYPLSQARRGQKRPSRRLLV